MRLFAIETIDYQNNDNFGDKLTALVEEIFSSISNGDYKTNSDIFKTNLPKRLELLIKDRFGLNVAMDAKLHYYLPAAIIPFSSDYLANIGNTTEYVNNHFTEMFGVSGIFKHIKSIDQERQKYYKRIHNKTGYFNRKYARVGGYLSDVKHYMILNFFTLHSYGLTPKEVAAVISHEIGHALEGLVNHYKLQTNNSAIMDTINELNKNNTEKALYVFKRYFGEEAILDADLNKDSIVTDFYPVLVKRYLDELDSQLMNSKYDETNFEYLADNFATKLNLGKELVTGLQKIYTDQGIVYENNKTRYFIIYIIEVLCVALSMVLFGLFGISFFTIVVLFFSGYNNKHMTYDIPIDRYKRISNAIIKNLSNPDLPKEFVIDLIKQLEYIDSIVSKSQNLVSVTDTIANIMIPVNREIKHYIEVQQTIENSLNHRLFVQSAKLRHE